MDEICTTRDSVEEFSSKFDTEKRSDCRLFNVMVIVCQIVPFLEKLQTSS